MLSSRGTAVRTLLRAGVVALAIALVLAPVALTKTKGKPVAVTAHAGDKATLTLTKATNRALKKAHVTIQALKPSTHKKSTITLPTKSGKWNFTAANGTLNLKGALRVKRGKRTQKLGTLVFSRGARGGGQLTVKVRGKKVKLFDMAKKGVKAKTKGNRQTVSKFSATLTKKAATLLNKALKHKVFRAKQKIGTFQVTVSSAKAPAKPAPGAGAPGAAPTSGVGISFARALDSVPGLSVTPLGSASGTLPAPLGTTPLPVADGTAVTLPLPTGGDGSLSFDNGTLTGTVPLSGGIQLDNGAASVTLTNPVLTLGTGTDGSSLSVSLNGGPEVKLLDIDTSKLLQSATPSGGLSLQGLLAELSSEGAASLNQLLGTNAFTTGQPIAGLSVILPNAPSS